MSAVKKQTTLYRGIYEFEDPSGCLVASRIPAKGSADFYKGTAVTVRPNQCAMVIYKGQIADILPPGLHLIQTENVPVLTKLANWKFGFESPLRCEIWFFSGQRFANRRWGTAAPVLVPLGKLGTVPLRAYGTYSLGLKNPVKLYSQLIGNRTSFDITEVEELVQAKLMNHFPTALQGISTMEELSRAQKGVGERLEAAVTTDLEELGLVVRDVHVLGLLPAQEVLDAMDSQAAMKVLGNSRDYFLYKAANAIGSGEEGRASDPMQLMLSLMVSKGLAGADYHEQEASTAPVPRLVASRCGGCQKSIPTAQRFCGHCGKEQT